MINFDSRTKFFMKSTPTDMRKGYEGLASIVRDVMGHNPRNYNEAFVFYSKDYRKVKILHYDINGWVLFYDVTVDGKILSLSASQIHIGLSCYLDSKSETMIHITPVFVIVRSSPIKGYLVDVLLEIAHGSFYLSLFHLPGYIGNSRSAVGDIHSFYLYSSGKDRVYIFRKGDFLHYLLLCLGTKTLLVVK